MGREHEDEAVTYFIEVRGKWPRSQKRTFEIIGWAIAQFHGPNDPTSDWGPDGKGYETWYSGGGPWVSKDSEVYCSLGDHYGPYTGEIPKFVKNNHYAAVFPRRARAEEVAMLMAVKHPELVGRLYLSGVTRLGPVNKDATLCERPKRLL